MRVDPRRLQRRRPGRTPRPATPLAALARALARIAVAAPARGLTWTAAAGPGAARRQPGAAVRHPDGYLQAHRGRHVHPGRPGGHAVPYPGPGQPGRRAAAPARAARRGHRPAGRRGGIPGGHPRARTRCAATSTAATTATCAPTARSTGSPGGAPAAPTRTPARRSWPASARRRAGSAPTRSPRWCTRWRTSTRSARPPPRPRSSPAASSPPATPGSAPTPPPTRWRSAWTPAARSGWTRSPGCSAPARTTPARELGTLVFDDPGTGRLIPAAEYLSGKVRDKLEAAERAAADDPRYAVNVDGTAQGHPGRPDARRDRRPARRGLDRRRPTSGQFLARDPRRPRRAGRASRRADLGRPRQPATRVLATSTWGTEPLPRPGSSPRRSWSSAASRSATSQPDDDLRS